MNCERFCDQKKNWIFEEHSITFMSEKMYRIVDVPQINTFHYLCNKSVFLYVHYNSKETHCVRLFKYTTLSYDLD